MIDDESDPLLEMYGYVTGDVSGQSLEQTISLGQASVEQSEVSALHPDLGVLDISGAVRRFFDNSP